jgi:hypothetical protein
MVKAAVPGVRGHVDALRYLTEHSDEEACLAMARAIGVAQARDSGDDQRKTELLRAILATLDGVSKGSATPEADRMKASTKAPQMAALLSDVRERKLRRILEANGIDTATIDRMIAAAGDKEDV